ncbi:MAG: hypothetical protein DMD69_13515 [Gemmatimonadetes bacterium]|nr:MAG: hypothetical protein DMD69_13515 [Gemmatimonadota bacterium]
MGRRQGVVDRGVEHRPREVAHALDCLVGGHLLLIGSGGAEGIVDLGGADDAGRQGNLFAAQPVWVAGAVPALMVAAHCRNDVAKV